MKKSVKIIILIFLNFFAGFVYGYFVHRNRIFPSNMIRKAYMANLYRKEMDWSIGIYTGNSPFTMSAPEEIDNPVLTAKDVTDADAAFVADPFMVLHKGKYYMFFEVLNMDTFHGDIGYATSNDGKSWEYGSIVLDEPFHLSFPGVYEVNGEYYMIPESEEDNSIRLYRASSFPGKWEYVSTLLSGERFNDPVLLRHKGKFWIFVSRPGFDVLNLFYSDSLTSGWKPHPMNPLIENNKHIANPAGKILEYKGDIYRITQDCLPYYGTQVHAVRIMEMTEDSYMESPDSIIKIVYPSGKGWNAAGMHQADILDENGVYRAAVDGIRRR